MTLERLGVPSEDVLGTNYTVTSLTVSDYNPSIDGTVTLTVTVKDVYNSPVVGEGVTVTASEGNFTQYNGSTITGASSYTGTTNSSGQFTLTYACSEWGLITFSANNRSLQINVTGFKQIKTYASGFYTLYVDDSKRLAKLRVSISNSNINSGESYLQSGFVPTSYRPNGQIISLVNRVQSVDVQITSAGDVAIYNPTSSTVSSFTGTTIAYWDY